MTIDESAAGRSPAAQQSRAGTRLPLLLMGLLIGGYALRVALVWNDLPAVLMSHFGVSGRPDGWMSKGDFFALDSFVIALIAAIPLWVRILPPQLINVPLRNRAYWFAPERRRESLGRMAPWFSWMSLLATAYMIFVLDQVVRANLNARPASVGPIAAVATLAFVLIMAGGSLAFYRVFRAPAGPPRA
jgi:Protein of unknown function (DUF1648)